MARTKRKVNLFQPVSVPEAPEQRKYRTGGYIRLSVEDSGRPGADTIEAQQELIRAYIDSQTDMEFCDLYCDNGRTGTNFERPGFERLMEDVRTGKINCIVVKDLSRFGRNYKETGNYLERIFPVLNVRFVAVNDNFDTLTAERSAEGYIIPLKNIINDVYSKDISRKSSSALAIKQQNGEFIGTWAAYGYQKCEGDRHHIEPDEETAPVVLDIFLWRISGMSYQQIARKLNELGVPSPSRYHYLKGDTASQRYANTKWAVSIVKKILTNEVYLGHMVQGRKRSEFTKGGKQRLVPKSEWVVVRNTHEPLIDEDMFQIVQKMAEDAAHTYQERLGRHNALGTTPNIFRGLLYCADCKRPLTRYKSVTSNGQKLSYVFICPTHSAQPDSCPKKYLHEPELKAILWDTLRQEIALAADLTKRVRQYTHSAKMTGHNQIMDREITAAKQALARSERLYDSLYRNYVDKLMTEREYVEMKRQYRADMERAQARLDELDRQRQEEHQKTEKNPWLTACSQFQQETELTAEMAHALIERVEIDAENHVSIHLRYQDQYRSLVQLLEKEAAQA